MNLRGYLIEDENQNNLPELTIESFRGKAFKFHINRGVCVFRIKDILNNLVDLDYDVYLPSKQKNLQRKFVWTLLQKQELIISLYKGIKLPPITLIERQSDNIRDKRSYQVVDGKQRLSALVSFANNAFPIEWDGCEYYFRDLSDHLQKEILFYYPVADVGYDYNDELISDAEKIRWFELINFFGTPQDAEHLKSLKQ